MSLPIDYVSVRNELIAKQGYSVAPQAGMLEDLRALMENMSGYRSQNTCDGHTQFGAPCSGHLSTADFEDVIPQIRPRKCQCQGEVVGCLQHGFSPCSCNNNPGCYCDGNTGCGSEGSGCSCNTDETSCYGHGVMTCGCDSDYQNCTCYADGGCSCQGHACACNSRAGNCSCNELFSF